jgi:hypothetical protein
MNGWCQEIPELFGPNKREFVNAGWNFYAGPDLDGNPRLVGGKVDKIEIELCNAPDAFEVSKHRTRKPNFSQYEMQNSWRCPRVDAPRATRHGSGHL